jgi:hypothetical protein
VGNRFQRRCLDRYEQGQVLTAPDPATGLTAVLAAAAAVVAGALVIAPRTRHVPCS